MADVTIDLDAQAPVIIEVEGQVVFPANVVGGNGIAVTREGVDYIIANTQGPLPGPEGPTGATGATGAAGAAGATGATGPAGPITAGSVVASGSAIYTANADISAILPIDDTIPQVGEGFQILSVAITPKSTTNKLRTRFYGVGALLVAPNAWCAALFVNGAANAVRAAYTVGDVANSARPLGLDYEYTPGSTTLQTLTLRVGPGTATILRLNGNTASRFFGGVMAATLVVEEIQG